MYFVVIFVLLIGSSFEECVDPIDSKGVYSTKRPRFESEARATGHWRNQGQVSVLACKVNMNPPTIEDRIKENNCSWMPAYAYYAIGYMDTPTFAIIRYHPSTIIRIAIPKYDGSIERRYSTFQTELEKLVTPNEINDQRLEPQSEVADCLSINGESYLLSLNLSESSYIDMLERPYRTYAERINNIHSTGSVTKLLKYTLCVQFEARFYVPLDKMPHSFNTDVPIYVCKTNSAYSCRCENVGCVLRLSDVNNLSQVCADQAKSKNIQIPMFPSSKYVLPGIWSSRYELVYDGLVYLFLKNMVSSSSASSVDVVDWNRDAYSTFYRVESNITYTGIQGLSQTKRNDSVPKERPSSESMYAEATVFPISKEYIPKANASESKNLFIPPHEQILRFRKMFTAGKVIVTICGIVTGFVIFLSVYNLVVLCVNYITLMNYYSQL